MESRERKLYWLALVGLLTFFLGQHYPVSSVSAREEPGDIDVRRVRVLDGDGRVRVVMGVLDDGSGYLAILDEDGDLSAILGPQDDGGGHALTIADSSGKDRCRLGIDGSGDGVLKLFNRHGYLGLDAASGRGEGAYVLDVCGAMGVPQARLAASRAGGRGTLSLYNRYGWTNQVRAGPSGGPRSANPRMIEIVHDREFLLILEPWILEDLGARPSEDDLKRFWKSGYSGMSPRPPPGWEKTYDLWRKRHASTLERLFALLAK